MRRKKKNKSSQKDRRKKRRQFYPWLTDWDDYCAKNAGNPGRETSERNFWLWRDKELRRHGSTSPRTDIDLVWKSEGKPYYNIHPMLAPKFCRVNLDKIPANMVEMPGGLSCVNMRLCQQHDALTMDESMTCARKDQWWNEGEVIPEGSWIRNFMLLRPSPIMVTKCFRGVTLLGPPERFLMVALDTATLTRHGIRIHVCSVLICLDGESLNDAIDVSCAMAADANPGYRKLVANCLRIAVTVGFLAHANDEMIEPDVILKLRERYANARPPERTKLLRQSRRESGLGYNVGNDIMFLGPQPVQGSKQPKGDGRELRYQHIRDGHPHAVRYGTGKSLVKVMWFQPTRVRRDLKFKSES